MECKDQKASNKQQASNAYNENKNFQDQLNSYVNFKILRLCVRYKHIHRKTDQY